MYKKLTVDQPIDFVIPWVDSSDVEWQTIYNQYSDVKIDVNNVRFRDVPTLKYFFRGVEKNAPWVRKIHFLTFGHVPRWLNLENEKLNIVRHSDFIPSEYLPTFSANTIELNMHKIKDLSENFVYFNDDMFLIKKLKSDYFFHKNLPRDSAILDSFKATDDIISNTCFNNLRAIRKHFHMRNFLKKPFRWINLKYGKYIVTNMIYFSLKGISSFYENHLPHSFKKSIIEEVWKEEYDILNKTCLNKFRTKDDVNQWLYRYWQLCQNEFYPRKNDKNSYRQLDCDINETCKIIEKQKVSMLCVNDSNVDNYEFKVKFLQNSFEKIFPEKSSFEI